MKHIRYKGCKHTEAFINRNGIPMEMALTFLKHSIDFHKIERVVAHNVDFDRGVLMHQDKKHFANRILESFRAVPVFCTMKETTNLCKLKSNTGFSSYKYPKLSELAEHLGVPANHEQLHGAAYDVQVTLQCVLKLASTSSKFKQLVHGTQAPPAVGGAPTVRGPAVKASAVGANSLCHVSAQWLEAKQHQQTQRQKRQQKVGSSVFASIHSIEKKRIRQEEEARRKRLDQERAEDLQLDLRRMGERVDEKKRREVMAEDQHLPDGKINPVWAKNRRHSQNGSNVTNIVGNGFCSPVEHCKHKLWPSTHKVNEVFCSWGNRNEDRCDDELATYLDQRVQDPDDALASYTIHHCGLVKETMDKGYSPDGYVEEVYQDGTTAVVLVEYKCPFTKRNMEPINGEPFNVFDDNPSDDPSQTIYGPSVCPSNAKTFWTKRPAPAPPTPPGRCRQGRVESDYPLLLRPGPVGHAGDANL